MDRSRIPWYGLANITNTLCPNIIVVNGHIFNIPGFLEAVNESAKKYVNPVLAGHVNIQLSSLGDSASLIGAGMLVTRDLYANPTSFINTLP